MDAIATHARRLRVCSEPDLKKGNEAGDVGDGAVRKPHAPLSDLSFMSFALGSKYLACFAVQTFRIRLLGARF
jgi:hypothetical protein